MSIATRTGDDGNTALMYGRRVPKTHPRIEACGTVDELNSALGLARATATDPWVAEELWAVQKDLVILMGCLAVAAEDAERYASSSFPKMTPSMLQRLDEGVAKIEEHKIDAGGWATPGANLHAAALDVARSTCRRAERRVLAFNSELREKSVLAYLNRLSDVLWLMARLSESEIKMYAAKN